MRSRDILEWLEGEIEGYPERATGNECEEHVVALAGRMLPSNREELVEAMRKWIEDRGRYALLAVRIADEYELRELKRDLVILLEDVRTERVFKPYYAEFIVPVLDRMA